MAALNDNQQLQLAAQLLSLREKEQHRLRKIDRYYKNKPDSIYVPQGAKSEYNWIRDRSKVNFLPLVVSVVSQNLHVDGYRPSPPAPPKTVTMRIDPPAPVGGLPAPVPGTNGTSGTSGPPPQPDSGSPSAVVAARNPANGAGGGVPPVPQVPQVPLAPGTMTIPSDLLFDATTTETTSEPWKYFMHNKMISRQHGLHRSIMKYGLAYMLVMPGELDDASMPVMTPHSPRRMTAFYADDVLDDWPMYAIEYFPYSYSDGSKNASCTLLRLYDDDYRYTLVVRKGSNTTVRLADPEVDPIPPGTSPIDEHGLGVCPVIRFTHEYDLDGDDDVSGEVEPLIPLQDQLNTTTFNMLIAQQFASFRQRWVTGMVSTDEDGRPVEPFRAGIDRLWVAEDADTKFGEFGQTDLKDYLSGNEAVVRHMSTIGQVPPYHLLGVIANLSAEALAAARDGLDRKIEELQATLNDPWKQTFQLAAHAGGDEKDAKDDGAIVVWRDTSARAFSATVDALGKISQMLGVPAPELWDRIPGVSAQDVARWKASLAQPGVLQELADLVERGITKGVQGETPGSSPTAGFYQTYNARPQGVQPPSGAGAQGGAG